MVCLLTPTCAASSAADLAYGQANRSELFGVVMDPAGLPVPGATVQLQDGSRPVETGADGRWHFFPLQPGAYRVTVSKNGFRTLVRDAVQVRMADRVSLDLVLAVGDVDESVEVTGDAPLLRTSTGAVSFVVSGPSVRLSESSVWRAA